MQLFPFGKNSGLSYARLFREQRCKYNPQSILFYFSLSIAVDERCDMELDETDPAVWLKLEAAVEEYIQSNNIAFKNACERLILPYQHDEKWSENFNSLDFSRVMASSAGVCFALIPFSTAQ